MTDYWKSNPRHYCEACKCWFGDNKISVEFHEGGRRHKANVERQLRESRKRASIKDKEAMKLSETLAQIEKAAMVSYQHDQLGLPPSKRVATMGVSLTPEMIQFEQQNIKKEMAEKLKEKKKEMDREDASRASPWQQLMSPEGYPYYYNTVTRVSQWELPEPLIATTVPSIATTVPSIATTVPLIATTAPSIATTVPSTATTAPSTATIVPSTATIVPSTATTVPSTATTVPSTATTVPLTATTIPSTATSVSPTDIKHSSHEPILRPYGSWTTISVRDQTEDDSKEDIPDNKSDIDSSSDTDDEKHIFAEKTLPTMNIKIEPGSFKGFSFKKKQNRDNIKERTSDW